MPLAVVRTGPNATPDSFPPMYLRTLGNTPLAWLAPDAATAPKPEIAIFGQAPSDVATPWPWFVNLLRTEPFQAGFTLDRFRYIPIVRNPDGTISYEYDGDAGDTIRFGDEVFGTVPVSGTVFQVTYRTGNGSAGNLAADAITGFNPAVALNVTTVTNPFAAMGGADEESDETVLRLAPQAFRAVRYNAVLAGDYAAAAEKLPWVERAGTVFRWTGSWLTVFTTADPAGSEQITGAEQLQLIQLLNRRRLAGYESYSPQPQYVAVDLEVYVCAQPSAFRGDVEAAVLKSLSAARNTDGTTGFFFTDNFTFGQPLERSALEAAIQNSYGVAGVETILYRQRGVVANYITLPDEVTIKTSQILRVDNDPSRPERGSLRVYVDGGK
jgi:predicted phage baseplate assembly protein